MSEMSYAKLDPQAQDVRRLIAASDAFYADLYPAESNHLESSRDLAQANVIFIGCRIDGRLVASGAAKLMHDDGDYAEIKRVFVFDEFRGRGISEGIMSNLEAELGRRVQIASHLFSVSHYDRWVCHRQPLPLEVAGCKRTLLSAIRLSPPACCQ